MATTQATAQFLRARETLLARREDYEAAHRTFIWPQFEALNWALDYFDVYAAGNQRPALIIIDEDGPETRITFETLRERINRIPIFCVISASSGVSAFCSCSATRRRSGS